MLAEKVSVEVTLPPEKLAKVAPTVASTAPPMADPVISSPIPSNLTINAGNQCNITIIVHQK
jgi:hypothetical protein